MVRRPVDEERRGAEFVEDGRLVGVKLGVDLRGEEGLAVLGAVDKWTRTEASDWPMAALP
jgi:hypothetical protein